MSSQRKRTQRAKRSLFKPSGKGEAFCWIAGVKVYKERDHDPQQVLYGDLDDKPKVKRKRLTPVFIQHKKLMKKNRDRQGAKTNQ